MIDLHSSFSPRSANRCKAHVKVDIVGATLHLFALHSETVVSTQNCKNEILCIIFGLAVKEGGLGRAQDLALVSYHLKPIDLWHLYESPKSSYTSQGVFSRGRFTIHRTLIVLGTIESICTASLTHSYLSRLVFLFSSRMTQHRLD